MKANQPQWAFAKSRRWDLESWSALQDLEESTLIPFTNLSPSFCLVVVSGSNLEFLIFFNLSSLHILLIQQVTI